MERSIFENRQAIPDRSLRFGLAIKRLLIKRSVERSNEPYLVTYFGSQASAETKVPLMAVSRRLTNVRRGQAMNFGGLGMLALAPVPIGSLAVWHVELWESDRSNRSLGQLLAGAAREAHQADWLVKALLGGQVGLATETLTVLVRSLGKLLRADGDDLLYSWAGSLYDAQLVDMSGSQITAGNELAEITFTILGEEVGP